MGTGLTVLQDSREQMPLRFPANVLFRWRGHSKAWKVQVRVATLHAGDYTFDTLQRVVAVERKGSARELHRNLCTADRKRFLQALERLVSQATHPCLFLDMTVREAFAPTQHLEHPSWALDSLFVECARLKLPVLWVPPSRNLWRSGEVLLKWMLAAALQEGAL